eukprot:8040144-Pyramimonas_sp.AAC.1
MLDVLLRPRIAGRCPPEPSATLPSRYQVSAQQVPPPGPPYLARNSAAQGLVTYRGTMSHSRHAEPLRQVQLLDGVPTGTGYPLE